MILEKNGVRGKTCPSCDTWKPLEEFPRDSSKGESQGGRHCRCKECHKRDYQKLQIVTRQLRQLVAT